MENNVFIDYYKTLHLTKDATQKEIKDAYRRLAMTWHPDRSDDPLSEVVFREINAAYRTLKNPVKRKIYDGQYNRYYTNNTTSTSSHSQPDSNHNHPRHIYFVFPLTLEQLLFGHTTDIYIPQIEKEVSFTIPPGTDEGKFLTIYTDGHYSFYIKTQLIKHEFYSKEGLDLIVDIAIDYYDAILGCSFQFKHLNETVEVNIPKNTQNNDKIVIYNKGFKSSIHCGDLIFYVTIKTPKKASKKERQLLKQIKAINMND